MTGKFLSEFNRRMETLNCIPLKEKYYDSERRCEKMMVVSAEVLEEIINEYKQVYSINR